MSEIRFKKPTFFMDGNMWCATAANFVNLQESHAGFGETQCDALNDLNKTLEKNGLCPLSPFQFDVKDEASGALEALLDYSQADMDGIIVTTSRQAIHEVADELTTLRERNRQLREALAEVAGLAEMTGGLPPMSTVLMEEIEATARTALSRTGEE